LADDKAVTAWERYHVDLTKSTVKAERTVIDAGTGQPRKGYWSSAWELDVRKALGRRPDPIALAEVVALAKTYDKFDGQARQLGAVREQVAEIAKTGGMDGHGEIAIRTRYAKLSN